MILHKDNLYLSKWEYSETQRPLVLWQWSELHHGIYILNAELQKDNGNIDVNFSPGKPGQYSSCLIWGTKNKYKSGFIYILGKCRYGSTDLWYLTSPETFGTLCFSFVVALPGQFPMKHLQAAVGE